MIKISTNAVSYGFQWRLPWVFLYKKEQRKNNFLGGIYYRITVVKEYVHKHPELTSKCRHDARKKGELIFVQKKNPCFVSWPFFLASCVYKIISGTSLNLRTFYTARKFDQVSSNTQVLKIKSMIHSNMLIEFSSYYVWEKRLQNPT